MGLDKVRDLFKRKRHNEVMAFRNVMNTEEGKIVLRAILRESHINELSVRATDDPNEVFFREGERSIGLFVANTLNMSDNALAALLRNDEITTIEGMYNDN